MRNDYDRYLREMDASMRQKVALTAVRLLCEGNVADMGCGSGAQSAGGAVPGVARHRRGSDSGEG